MSVPGTYHHWKVVPNPEFEGMTPHIMEAVCHDRTPFLTVSCPLCTGQNHIHESQVAKLDPRQLLGVRCQSCMRYTDMRVSMVQGAFAQMRDEGWIL